MFLVPVQKKILRRGGWLITSFIDRTVNLKQNKKALKWPQFTCRYYLQQPHVRRALNLGSRSMSDGLEIYKAMIEDTMQDIR